MVKFVPPELWIQIVGTACAGAEGTEVRKLLCNLSLVCKTIHAVSQQKLYASLDVMSSSNPFLHRTLRSNPELACYVKALSIRWSYLNGEDMEKEGRLSCVKDFEMIWGHCSNLCAVSIDAKSTANREEPPLKPLEDGPSADVILPHDAFDNVTSFTVVSPSHVIDPMANGLILLPMFTGVTYLVMEFAEKITYTLSRQPSATLLPKFSSNQTLLQNVVHNLGFNIQKIFLLGDHAESTSSTIYTPTTEWSTAHSLLIEAHNVNCQNLFQHLPLLTTVKFGNIPFDPFGENSIFPFLSRQPCAAHLTGLELEGYSWTRRDDWHLVFRHFPRLGQILCVEENLVLDGSSAPFYIPDSSLLRLSRLQPALAYIFSFALRALEDETSPVLGRTVCCVFKGDMVCFKAKWVQEMEGEEHEGSRQTMLSNAVRRLGWTKQVTETDGDRLVEALTKVVANGQAAR